jgi:acyl-CoA synthetase (NDP forming)
LLVGEYSASRGKNRAPAVTKCYPDLQSIPGGIDGAVIITRPEITERIVRDCSDAGTL